MGVIWITGLSGAGKTAIATDVVRRLRLLDHAAELIDGDAVRARHGDRAYDKAGRIAAAHRLSDLAADVSARGGIAVVATISLFHEIHAANRLRHEVYLEVLVCSDDANLRRRSPVYALEPHAEVVGRGLAAEFPLAPHCTLRNEADGGLEILAQEILDRWFSRDAVR